MGIVIAISIITLWGAHLFYLLYYFPFDPSSLLFYLHIGIQTYFFTGLFITAHDSMHGTVSKRKRINSGIGELVTFLYAGLSYQKLKKKHILHHKFPGTEKDPDYSEKQNFIIWYYSFMKEYISFIQIIIMAISFNLLKIISDDLRIISFWVIPAILSTFQLFYFGTYKPHKKPHSDKMKPHNARSLSKNHFWAMISCYFFGYHYEHHSFPNIPWWRLSKKKKSI